ncbi:GNAT family N-acetyltransferase [uncultured Victivallis sp.]|uniref:GNAT family N-acetyltransferase n=1 Tax=uncultured Victivallis sp. TaxID=354118 RepID=UPI0025967E49|nr:GNAT family N-acetyltransferase [uncultured Victivallis sp.]
MKTLECRRFSADEEPPWELLLLADPSEEMVRGYLTRSELFGCFSGKACIAVAAVVSQGEGVCELKNLAVVPPRQRHGIGRLLLDYVCDCCAENFRVMEVGTGNSSIGNQHFYRSMGFHRFRTDRGFFLRNYPEPIEENGLLCTDLVKFRKVLARSRTVLAD